MGIRPRGLYHEPLDGVFSFRRQVARLYIRDMEAINLE